MTLPLAVVAGALSNDPRQAAVAARTLGFAGLLFNAVSPGLDVTDLTGSGRREFRQVLSGQNRQLVGLQVDLGSKGMGPGADVDRLLSRLDKIFEAAAGLVAPLVCVEVGPLPEPPRAAVVKPAITPEQAGLILIPSMAAPAEVTPPVPMSPADVAFAAHVDAAAAELGVRADRYNVAVAFRSELASLAAVERMLSAARCPWFGLDLDPVNLLRDEWTTDEAFARLGPLVRHVRGKDAVCGADRRTKPASVGRGDTKWDRTLADLDAAGYHGWVTLDPNRPERPPRRRAGGAGVFEAARGLTGRPTRCRRSAAPPGTRAAVEAPATAGRPTAFRGRRRDRVRLKGRGRYNLPKSRVIRSAGPHAGRFRAAPTPRICGPGLLITVSQTSPVKMDGPTPGGG